MIVVRIPNGDEDGHEDAVSLARSHEDGTLILYDRESNIVAEYAPGGWHAYWFQEDDDDNI